MAENTVLLFQPDHIDWGVKKLDDFIKSKSVIVEALDGPACRLFLNQTNKFVSPYVPDDLKPEIHSALDAVIDEAYDEAIEDAIDLLGELVDKVEILKPGVKELLKGVLEIISATLVSLLPEESEE